jgi:CelD/BcsL family acetyltransferase involved in cellulose biosynthesis
MKRLSLETFESQLAAFDADVLATPAIDAFCSSSQWILPASKALAPNEEPFILRGEHGWATLLYGRLPGGERYLQPMEAAWLLASPLVGPNPGLLAEQFAEALQRQMPPWDVFFFSGVPKDARYSTPVLQALNQYFGLRVGPVTERRWANLSGGLGAYLNRRSRNFRRALKRAIVRADEAGVSFEPMMPATQSDMDAIYTRIISLEERSWKGRDEVGIQSGPMHEFYQRMTRRLAAANAFKGFFARHANKDVAYIFGGVVGEVYRGLQCSFDADYTELSLGNLCHYQQISQLCEEGFSRYDMGTEVAYKDRWADTQFETIALLVTP